ncbi:tonB family C-terminal domain protein, partial [Vibrio harveyi]
YSVNSLLYLNSYLFHFTV